MKYTLLLTQRGNLACSYCYIGKRDCRMPIEVTDKIAECGLKGGNSYV
jgi:MoaA/NifB/PqqE/SkfB family radical SAM enzyme